jgi:insertion element IS1 protein InsB
MWSYVGGRRDVWWIWVALDAETRQVVAMVAGDRSEDTARRLWETLPDEYRSGATVYS